MKTSFTFLTLTLVVMVVQTTLAKPNPYLPNINVNGLGNIGLSTTTAVPSTGSHISAYKHLNKHLSSSNSNDGKALEKQVIKTIFRFIHEAIQKPNKVDQNTPNNFTEKLRVASEDILKNANDLCDTNNNSDQNCQVKRNLAHIKTILHAFISGVNQEISTIRYQSKRQALEKVVNVLNEAYRNLNNLHSNVEDLYNNWQQNREHQELLIVRGWNNWAGEQMEKIAIATNGNEEKINEAENIINAFVNRYGYYLSKCADETEAELIEYEQLVNRTIARYDAIMATLISEVNECLQDDSSEAGGRCLHQFRESLRQLYNVTVKINTLSGVNLAKKAFETKNCVKQTRYKFGSEKFEVNKQITGIISRQDQNEDTATRVVGDNGRGDVKIEHAVAEDKVQASIDGEADASNDAPGDAVADGEVDTEEGAKPRTDRANEASGSGGDAGAGEDTNTDGYAGAGEEDEAQVSVDGVAGVNNDTKAGADADGGVDAETGANAYTGADAGDGAGAESGAYTDTSANAELGNDIETGAAAQTGADAKAGTSGTFIKKIRIVSEEILKNANDLCDTNNNNDQSCQVKQKITHIKAIIHAFISGVNQEISAIRYQSKRQALEKVVNVVIEAYRNLNNLHANVVDLHNNWHRNREHQELLIVRGWNNWAGEQLENIAIATDDDEAKMGEAENSINAFVNRYGYYLSKCADETEAELIEYEQIVDNTIARYNAIVAASISEVNECLQDDSSEAGGRCSREFRKSLRQLHNSAVEIDKLAISGANLVKESFDAKYCVKQTQYEFGLEKFALNKQITRIISRQDQN